MGEGTLELSFLRWCGDSPLRLHPLLRMPKLGRARLQESCWGWHLGV